jgi:hypothetical protein
MFKKALDGCEDAEREARKAREQFNEDLQALEDSLNDIQIFLELGLIQKAKDRIDEIIKSMNDGVTPNC